MNTNTILTGDCRERLAQLPENSVHMCMTSPPYFGLRDYGVDEQIGLEDSLQEYIDELVSVANELKRVLRDDGSCWLNLGDTYGGDSIIRSKGEWTRPGDEGYEEAHTASYGEGRRSMSVVGRKNKMLIPHRVAIALQNTGWVVRHDAPWIKDMPDPAKDRLRRGPEYIFHLTNQPDYWADGGILDHRGWFEISQGQFADSHFATFPEELPRIPIRATCPPVVCDKCGTPYEPETVNRPPWERELSDISRPQLRKAIKRAEEADLTTEHLEACRAVGFSDAGAGAECQSGSGQNTETVENLANEAKEILGGYFREFAMGSNERVGWSQACCCTTDETQPGIVLDPFAGAGTTLLKAKDLGRRFIGIELNPEYADMARARVGLMPEEPQNVRDHEAQSGLESFND